MKLSVCPKISMACWIECWACSGRKRTFQLVSSFTWILP